jgi:hypothetical protein
MKKSLLLILSILLLFKCNCSDETVNLGNHYFLRIEGTGTNDILSEYSEHGSIPCDVVTYNYNSDFIIAKQKPDKITSPMYDREFEYKNGRDSFYYWIIRHNPYIILGSLNENEFIDARKKYQVPDNLVMKSVWER